MTANPHQGVRIERIASRDVRRTQAGRIAVPLWVVKDGEHVGDGDLVLTHDEAAVLHAQLDRLLSMRCRAEQSQTQGAQ
jgi:hypothetical protein